MRNHHWTRSNKLVFIMTLTILFKVSSAANGTCDCDVSTFLGQYSCLCSDVELISDWEVLNLQVNHELNLTNADVTEVRFRNSSIYFTPPEIKEIFPAVRTIDLSSVHLSKLLPFENCKYLRNIRLLDNFLTDIGGSMFRNCSLLHELIFYRNLIFSVNETTFANLGMLETLDLGYNWISNISRATLSPLVSLKKLYIDFNELTFISERTFNDLRNLEILHLNNNYIVEIAENSLTGLKSLVELWLNDNRELNKIHLKAFKDLANVTNIYLQGNSIKTIENVFDINESKLETIDLTNNTISEIDPAAFWNLFSLRNLLLLDNVCVDENFIFIDSFNEVVRSLRNCYVNYNKTSIITKKVPGKCSKNSELGYTCVLNNVTYQSINDSFSVVAQHIDGKKDSDVEAVVFTDSNLLKIPPEIFNQFVSLEKVVARNANLPRVDEKTLENCERLKSIDLSENEITEIYDGAFNQCSNLTSINLSSNQIKKLSSGLFNNNINLETILLDRNQIGSIDPCNNVIRFELRKLRKLSLKWNICINNSFNNQDLHAQFDKVVLRDIKICYGFWFL